ncbi:MAG: hypothetical protein RL386_343, partial [Bacteroidota bacterium]
MLDIQKRLANSFYAILSLPSTAMGFALSVQISALSWILSTRYNLKIEEVGLVWAAGPLAGIFGQVIVGLISDKVWFWGGRRRPFILIGGFLAALMLLALPNIAVIGDALGLAGILGVAIAVALSLDLAINVSFNPTRSIIADVTPEGEQRTKGYTWMQTISGTFGVGAYAVGAIWGNYALIYFGAGLVLLLSLIPPFFIEEPRELQGAQAGRQEGKDSFQLWAFLKDIYPLLGFLLYAAYGMVSRSTGWSVPLNVVEYFCLGFTLFAVTDTLRKPERKGHSLIGFQKVLAAHSFTWIGIQTMFVYMYAYVKDTLPGLNDEAMGKVVSIAFLIFNAVAAILPALVLEPLTRKYGRVKTHLACIASMAFGYGAFLVAGKSETGIYALMALLGIGWAATVSLPFAIMSQKVDQSKMGQYMGMFNLSVVLPQLVCSLGIGILVSQAAGKEIIFYISAITLAVSAVCWYF